MDVTQFTLTIKRFYALKEKKVLALQEKKKIFALDTGTRSVVGIILEVDEEQYHVVDMVAIEHSERAMLDGQIHDVLSVSKIIKKIKGELEEKHGPLHKVAVAAAGRALITEKASFSIPISGKPMMSVEDVIHLEFCAIQKAQEQVAKKHENENKIHHYYCVGYSVLYYRLDGEEIGSLIDQQGDEASVEIIATFLPKVVVESLIAALQRSDLEVEALTLEPIAAINVLIPPSMRRLNVALVDIGAGTSDIAITDSGTVIAYGMVPIAGDEITEAISDEYLLDFPLAEKAKRDLLTNEEIKITDILGFEMEVPKEEIISKISGSIDKLATSIQNEILKLNGNVPPKAVMLIGGGSLTPELPQRLSKGLGLPENRVAIRGIDAIQKLTFSDSIKNGPEIVTPIGIAITAQKNPLKYLTVFVNEKPVRIFELKELTVGDALLAAGIKMNKLYGKPGMAMIVTLNGHSITIPGEHGKPPILQNNGVDCLLNDKIQNGDKITVIKGEDGEKATVQIKDLIDDIPTKTIRINDQEYTIKPTIKRNGERVSYETVLHDHDVIECFLPETIEDLLEELNLQHLQNELEPFKLILNGNEILLHEFTGRVLKNGVEVRVTHNIDDGDHITIERRKLPTIRDIAEMKHILLSHSIPVTFNGKEVVLTKNISEFIRNEKILSEDDYIYYGDKIEVQTKRFEPFIFQDLFSVIDIELPKNPSGNFILLKNNEPTSFHEQIKAGDQLELRWPDNDRENN